MASTPSLPPSPSSFLFLSLPPSLPLLHLFFPPLLMLVPFISSTPHLSCFFFSLQKSQTTPLYPHADSNIIFFPLSLSLSARPCITASCSPPAQHPSSPLLSSQAAALTYTHIHTYTLKRIISPTKFPSIGLWRREMR